MYVFEVKSKILISSSEEERNISSLFGLNIQLKAGEESYAFIVDMIVLF